MEGVIRGTFAVAIGMLFAAAAYPQAARPPAPVTVTNPIGQPVPVVQQGATQVLGDVNVNGMVEVGNTDANPVPVIPLGTQDVNIVGGTFATKGHRIDMPETGPNRVLTLLFDDIDASLVSVAQKGSGLVLVSVFGPEQEGGRLGVEFHVGLLEGTDSAVVPLQQKVRLRGAAFHCLNSVINCNSRVELLIVGD